jgi:DMSO/TMAO reductase YedYZ molybdopterin-dependent catalytic subunit
MLAQHRLASAEPFEGAVFESLVPLEPRGPQALVLHNEGLDGRLFADLTRIPSHAGPLPTEQFYIRTRASKLLPPPSPWQVDVAGRSVDATWFAERRTDLGEILMECSGNDAFGCGFGLLSVATWEGVRLDTVLETLGIEPTSAWLMVSGFDHYPEPSLDNPPSIEGADWIFPLDDLLASGAALVTHMNGQPLNAEHGAPLRLLVPNWYGCCSIKWVQQLTFVPADSPSTPHMRWFASRTQQDGTPELARDYRNPIMEVAATPVRFELWRREGRPLYRIMGVVWGGSTPAPGLQIRYTQEGPFEKVHAYEPPRDTRTWATWFHHYVPPEPTAFIILLQTDPPSVGTRLASGYYRRYAAVYEA